MSPQDLQIFLYANWPIAAAVAVTAIMVVYGFSSVLKGYKSITPEAAVVLMNEGAQVIDVRPSEAFKKGHIVDAKNIEFETLTQQLDTLDLSQKYLIYCQAGTTASKACAAMKKKGFENIHHLQLGLNGWQTASLPTVKSGVKDSTKSKAAKRSKKPTKEESPKTKTKAKQSKKAKPVKDD